MLTIDPSLVVARDREESVVSYVQIFHSLTSYNSVIVTTDHYFGLQSTVPTRGDLAAV